MRKALLSASLCFSAACSSPFEGESDREVRLFISELQAPATVQASGPLDGTAFVSTGGCLSFRRLEVMRTNSVVFITGIGHDASRPGDACTADIRVEPKAFRVNGPFADSVVLNARQPDGATLRRLVNVE